ncbi:hypothetical protein RHMOL_Rhmol03G0204800 [Rhododendron molle]|uniref:Uncharacterized protein n=1 Tax=Rhododendron molle TaxID=49168 RepID=A0ACC0PHW1_RHOML|nr:hypothetical protein RHMOL_Rhmol03G0204800 [Rhododendron molle]
MMRADVRALSATHSRNQKTTPTSIGDYPSGFRPIRVADQSSGLIGSTEEQETANQGRDLRGNASRRHSIPGNNMLVVHTKFSTREETGLLSLMIEELASVVWTPCNLILLKSRLMILMLMLQLHTEFAHSAEQTNNGVEDALVWWWRVQWRPIQRRRRPRKRMGGCRYRCCDRGYYGRCQEVLLLRGGRGKGELIRANASQPDQSQCLTAGSRKLIYDDCAMLLL